ncbi:MAG: 4-hydroxythreonine-4-phosphate dehydrogenase PdxA, partial [Planctomycetota bacterium]
MASHPPTAERTRPPVVLLTCGDPAGIGPEIVAAAWVAAPHDRLRLRVVADARMLAGVLARRGIAPPHLVVLGADDPRPSAAG